MSTTSREVRPPHPRGPQQGQKYARREPDARGPAPVVYSVAGPLTIHLPQLKLVAAPKVRVIDLGPCHAVELKLGRASVTLLCAQGEGEKLAEELMYAFGSAEKVEHHKNRKAYLEDRARQREGRSRRGKQGGAPR